MTVVAGNFSLSLAVLAAAGALLAAIAAGRFGSESILRAARGLMAGFFALVTLGSIALLIGLVGSDFSIAYVSHYTERALPAGYKLAAFWAGQEGSLLLWAWLLGAMSLIAVYRGGARPRAGVAERAAVVGVLAVVCGFFAVLMLFSANPFQVNAEVPADGHGLNPMLQNPGMIAHPPMLFLGYAGYTIPFALLAGALIAGRRDNEWVVGLRRWSIVSWLFLSIGILLGAQWAYVELGWGGYWAWDPVENASLLPWLTGTALLHSIIVQQHRGMFKVWNAFLVAITFVLCIFGTYLTRSGVISSVHAFEQSPIGKFFLTFLAIAVLFSVALIAQRRRELKSENPLEVLAGREGFFLATNVLLVGMTIVVLIGTIFPLISKGLGGQEVTAKPEFYNKVVAPLGLLLVALMAAGPLLVWGRDAGAKLARGMIVPGIAAAVAVIGFAAGGVRNAWALIAVAIAVVAALNILKDLGATTWARCRSHGENPMSALLRVLDGNHRRYGGQIVHVGMMMIVIGIVGSSLFNQKEDLAMKPGQPVTFARHTLVLNGLAEQRGPNYSALEADVTVTDPTGRTTTLKPQLRKYDTAEQTNGEVAIDWNWKRDLYLTLGGVSSDGERATIQAIVNPLVLWIWIGGGVLTLGGLVSLLPRLLGARVEEAARAEVKAPARPAGRSVRVQASA